jgi:hypothetical protein
MCKALESIPSTSKKKKQKKPNSVHLRIGEWGDTPSPSLLRSAGVGSGEPQSIEGGGLGCWKEGIK